MLYRQGDVFIEAIPGIPSGASRLGHAVLAEGELTGHQHRVEDHAPAEVYQHRGQSYLRVLTDGTRIVHDEHGPLVLDRGDYHFWRQREYDPGAPQAPGVSVAGLPSARLVFD
ncbi:MAG: hypothetical protein K1X74_13110 [Pirellulales bacterium]|nr:hypothetical protein [Pirellulales bacterium]